MAWTTEENAKPNGPCSRLKSPRPLSAVVSPSAIAETYGHPRTNSMSAVGAAQAEHRRGTAVGTFAPKFIETGGHGLSSHGKEGEIEAADFSGRRYVWLRDAQDAFVKGWITGEAANGALLVQKEDGSQQQVDAHAVDKVNPAKFDKVGDMAELTHLNEASVVHNLRARFASDLIYTYSGLFLVTVNPYQPLPIYGDAQISAYNGRSRDDTEPHIFAIADCAFRRLVDESQNQSILVTGESGAGKTENTKKVIQYLAAVAKPASTSTTQSGLSEQILQANPILEAFGNAQTVRNNNSSRFGKFIRIGLTRSGQITGAHIDWYLLEKSRVARISKNERNYHVFYQLLQGLDRQTKQELLIANLGVEDFEYTAHGNATINGVSDKSEWNALLDSFRIMGFHRRDWLCILRMVAAVLCLGNISAVKESLRADQAALHETAHEFTAKASQLLGIDNDAFVAALLRPRVKAGRELVQKAQTPEQVRAAVDALAKSIYERTFGDLVSKINRELDRTGLTDDDATYIGVLDIAGFEIFQKNSFEQLCINYTNEKLQQFFNHHMFVLEQEEYAREQIEWKFIDFGKDLQPAIDLIEISNPVGILSCLDEDSVMPKATDRTFTEKLNDLWANKTSKFKPSRLSQGFILTHYAADVEYSTEGWLEKNRDPLNDNVTALLAASTEPHVAALFADCATSDAANLAKSKTRKGLFRTVAQRHKEQLSSLMSQLHSTHPHFVRCILPNHNKKARNFCGPLVLDQLRCNGVLEGIRIARTGFPNRLPFMEFLQRYEVLCKRSRAKGVSLQNRVFDMLEQLKLDRAIYRVGLTKVFLRAGVLADLEDQRDTVIRTVMTNFQCQARGYCQRRTARKTLYRSEAAGILRRNFQLYLQLKSNPWWSLFLATKPLLGATQSANEIKHRDVLIEQLRQNVDNNTANLLSLEGAQRKVEQELQTAHHKLDQERADKEMLLERLRSREMELNDRLAGSVEDQEHLERQLEELIAAKRKTEASADMMKAKLQQAGALMERLEAEKGDLIKIMAEKDARLQKVERQKHSQQETRLVRSQLEVERGKVASLEAKLLDSAHAQDLEKKERAASRADLQQIRAENEGIKVQLQKLTATTTKYEDLLRRKESESALVRTDLQALQTEGHALKSDKDRISAQLTAVMGKSREIQAQNDVMKAQKAQSEREILDLKQTMDAKLSADAQAKDNRKLMEDQLADLKSELFEVQADLSRERQSRDDVQVLGNHKLGGLQEEFQHIKEAKIEIEKELYLQQDTLRRATEARNGAESDRKRLQNELKMLRDRYAEAETSRIEANQIAERNLRRQVNQQNLSMQSELDEKTRLLEEARGQQLQWQAEVRELRSNVENAGIFEQRRDQGRDRLESELVTLRGRLMASENDNRALLNKVQQKNLDIARSQSKVTDDQRLRTSRLQSDRTRLEEEKKNLQRQQNQSQVDSAILEKQKEKLQLELEDLHHEIESARKVHRGAEKAASTSGLQVTELTHKLQLEEKARIRAQANCKQIQGKLDQANEEVGKVRQQLHDMRSPGLPPIERKGPLEELHQNTVAGRKRYPVDTEREEIMRETKARLEVDLRDAQSELREVLENQTLAEASQNQAMQKMSNLRVQLDTECARAEELERSLLLYKGRADEYFGKLEQAEITVLKATRAQQQARDQAQESEETAAQILAERKEVDDLIEDLQRQNQAWEAKVEDMTVDFERTMSAKKRLQHELDDYRNSRTTDIESKEAALQQARQKYQQEFAHLNAELQSEKEHGLQVRSEKSRLRDEVDKLRTKWDDELLKSSTWAKEKARIEASLQEMAASREQASTAHDDAQREVGNLLSLVSELRNSVDEGAAELSLVQKEKRGLETRLAETTSRLERLAREEKSPGLRDAALADQELLEIKSQLAHQQDVATAAVGKMRKADALGLEMQKDLAAERATAERLHQEKAQLEKATKEMQGQIVDLETRSLPVASQDVRFLKNRVQELESELEQQEDDRASSQRSVRSVDRTVRDLQSQLGRRDKLVEQLNEDVMRGRDKVERLLASVDELQAEESRSQLAARRAERDLREEREKSLRLERELEGWKSLRTERGTVLRSEDGRGSDAGLGRMLSMTKGFL